jgi:Family of unknown function (DUF6011)
MPYQGRRYYQRSSAGAYQAPRPNYTQTGDADQMWAVFAHAHPAESAWIFQNMVRNEFAASLHYAVCRYGSLTERQMSAVQRSLQPRAAGVTCDVSRIVASFDAARQNGIRQPKLTINGITIKRAGDNSRNPGSLYVFDHNVYVGKITDGVFLPGRDFVAGADTQARLLAIAADPQAAAATHGLRTGSCACCGRTLTDPLSVAVGIGPICIQHWGWRTVNTAAAEAVDTTSVTVDDSPEARAARSLAEDRGAS